LAEVDSLLEEVRQAVAERKPIYPLGGGTQQHRLADISEPGITISTRSLNRVIDYPHEDMTITVEAGMTMAELQQTLAQHRQTLPIDVPLPEQATVGGSLAANISGPRRLGHGTWRDYVLGITWINDQGQLAKAGGRVVKNVAGYDFCKLFCGSLGTLGIVTQVTLKVKPIAEKRVVGQALLENIHSVCYTLQLLPIRPTLVTITKNAHGKERLTVLFEDNPDSVACSVEELKTSKIADSFEWRTLNPEQLHVEFAKTSPLMNSIEVQIHVPRSKSDAFLRSIEYQRMQMTFWEMEPLLGRFRATLPSNDPSSMSHISVLIQQAMTHDGLLFASSMPKSMRTSLEPWGKPRPDWKLMREVKRALDPHDLFQRNRHEILRSHS
jgi:glycolate oxidase FAD binding subunit